MRGNLNRHGLAPAPSAALVLFAFALAGCSAPEAPPTVSAPPAGANATPTPRADDTTPGGGAAPTEARLPTADGPASGAQITATIDGTSLTFPIVAVCAISEESVEISASDSSGAGGVVVSWRADRPPAETAIAYLDLDAALTLVAGPDVATDSPPQVTVSGDAVEIVAELHDAALDRPPQTMRLQASCPDSPSGDVRSSPDLPDLPSGSGRGVVSVAGETHEFTIGEQCLIDERAITVQLENTEGHALNVTVLGNTGFMSVSLDGEQWTAGFSGEPMSFTIEGSRATWSGVALDTFTDREEQATVELECSS